MDLTTFKCPCCDFSSTSQKGCNIHLTKKHPYHDSCPNHLLLPGLGICLGSDHFSRAMLVRDSYRNHPLANRRFKRSLACLRPAAHEALACSSTNGNGRSDPKEAVCGLPPWRTLIPNKGDHTVHCSTTERESFPDSSAPGGTCTTTTDQGPFTFDFRGMCPSGGLIPGCPAFQPTSPESLPNLSTLSLLSPPIDQSDSLPGLGSCAQSSCNAPCSGGQIRTTVETYQHRSTRTIRRRNRTSQAASECHAHSNESEPAPATDFGIDSAWRPLCSDFPLLRKLWPTRISEDLALPQDPDLPEQSVTEIKVCSIFMKILGDCVALDYLPASKWDILVRCCICGKPLGGMQDIEDHVKDHLEESRHQCSICELPRVIHHCSGA